MAPVSARGIFLPDFCHIRSVFLLVISGQLLAFVLVIVAPGSDPWLSLGLASLFVQWIALTSAALLCLLRPLLSRVGNAQAATASYLLILLTAALISSAGEWVLPLGLGPHFVARSVAITAIVAIVVLRYLYVAYEWRQRLESEARARVEALQARIRPHFLFNSLNTIASMIPEAPERAEAAVLDLADLFRASLALGGRLVPLAEELELARGYLRMEALRLGERLQMHWDTDALPGDALLPPLTLQPLLENAVHHGIEPRPEGGLISVSGRVQGRVLELRIENPGPIGGGRRRAGAGMALENIRERLRLAFGTPARLTAEAGAEVYRVELKLPYRPEHESTDRR